MILDYILPGILAPILCESPNLDMLNLHKFSPNQTFYLGWMSCIHYKFRNNSKHDTIQFDGSYITVGEIKQAILGQKKMGKAPDFTLQIINAQTQERKLFDDH